MAFWSNLQIGDPIPPESAFGGGFEADYSKPLGGVGGILGTARGYDGDPFGGMTYPRDGQYKMGSHLQFHQNYATGYQYPWVSDQRNNEQIVYRHPHSPDLDPNFLDSYEVRNGELVMKVRPTTQAERDSWARFKGVKVGADGQSATAAYLKAKFGESTLLSWGASQSALNNDNGTVFLQNAPSDHLGNMISTYNRKSISFGRSGMIAIFPSGAKIDGDPNDRSNIYGWFPAFWELEDVQARTDINDRLHTLDTYTPGNVGAGGNLTELDILELFGKDKLDVTSHLYNDGYTAKGGAQTTGGRRHWRSNTVAAFTSQTARILKDTYAHLTCDKYPPIDGDPGKIIYGLNGFIVWIEDMPRVLGEPKIDYEPVSELGGDRAYVPYVHPDTALARRLGIQRYESNGQPAYTHMCNIINVAQIASFSRAFLYQDFLNNNLQAYREQDELIIQRHYMHPLLDDNPDSRPFIDYEAGETAYTQGTTKYPYYDSNGTLQIAAPGYYGADNSGNFDDASGPDTTPQATGTFEETFRYRVVTNQKQHVDSPINVRCEITNNPVQYDYEFVISIDEDKVPAGVKVHIGSIEGNQAAIYADAEIDVADIIRIEAIQVGEPPVIAEPEPEPEPGPEPEPQPEVFTANVRVVD